MINWREIPYTRLLFSLIAGILVAIYLDCNIPFGIPFLLGLSAIAIFYNRPRLGFLQNRAYSVLMTLILFLVGYQLAYFNTDLRQAGHFRHHLQKENTYQATISNMPIFKNKAKLELQLQHILVDDNWQAVSGKILAYADLDSISSSLVYGDVVEIQSKINSIKAPSNPEQFDLKQYYQFQNIHYQSFIKKGQLFKTDQNTGQLFFKIAYSIRKQFIGILEKHLSGDELAVAKALILGYKANLTDDIKDAYANTGAMHVLAVSGLHVGILSSFLFFFFNKIPTRTRRSKLLVAGTLTACIFGFAFITGASPSVLRAATMFSFITFARVYKSTVSIYNILAVSAFLLLCINPFALMHVGFQLSYLAVLGIVYFQPKIQKLLFFENKYVAEAWSLTAVAIAAQIATLPISLYYFHQFPVYFLLSSIFVVPMAGIIMRVGLGLFMLQLIPFLSDILGLVLSKIVLLMNVIIQGLESLPMSVISGIWISSTSVLLLYLFIGLVMVAIENRRLRWASLSVLPMAFFLFINMQQIFNNDSTGSLVIYDIAKNSLLDFYHNGQVISLQSSHLTDKKIAFSAENYRTFRGVTPKEPLIFEDLEDTANQVFFKDKSILIIQESNPEITVAPDYILVRNNPRLDLTSLLADFQPEKVIFDSSNSNKNIDNWIQSCKNQQVAYHVTSTSGAFITTF